MATVTVPSEPLDAERRAWFDAARACIDQRRMRRFNQQICAIHSPTGAERELAEFLAGYLYAHGLEGHYQPLDETSGNVHATLRGSGGGPALLLYSPIDTHLDVQPDDLPWVGPGFRPDMLPVAAEAELIDDPEKLLIGLGAANPKAMVTTLFEAMLAIKEAGLSLKGDLILGCAGGGMPWNAAQRGNRGLSDGVFHLLTRGAAADFAIVMKPYNHIYHEEPGLCWFKVTVKGTLGYAGMARGRPGFESSIVPAAHLIIRLENWLQQYALRNKGGQVVPQGWISAIRSGWPDKPAFPSAATDIYLDVRCHPATTPAEVKAQFAEGISEIVRQIPSLRLEWEMIAAYPGASTDPQNWIIRAATRAWEQVEGRAHGDVIPLSGQTDISTLRNMRVPTVRIGWNSTPTQTPEAFREGLGGMGVSYVPDLVPACEKIIHTIIDTCTRSRAEVGLSGAAL